VTPLTGMGLPSAPTSRQPDQLPMFEWFSATFSQTSAQTILTAAPVSIMNRILPLGVSPTTKYKWVGFTADNFIILSLHTLLSVKFGSFAFEYPQTPDP